MRIFTILFNTVVKHNLVEWVDCWYNIFCHLAYMKNKKQDFCTKCGSLVVETEKFIRQSGNPLYPITVTRYRCTNDSCQAETDKKIADLKQQRLDREERSKKMKSNKQVCCGHNKR